MNHCQYFLVQESENVKFKHPLSKACLGDLELRSRIIMTPMGANLAELCIELGYNTKVAGDFDGMDYIEGRIVLAMKLPGPYKVRDL